MSKNKVFAFSALSIAVAMSLYACGGGGSSGGDEGTPPPAQQVTLSGKVSVPAALATASLQKGWGDNLLDFLISPTFAELIGLQALAGATVEVIELDAAGVETGTILASTTTNNLGQYSFTNSAIKPGSRYIIKVTKNALTIRAPLFSKEVNVDPGTEAVVQQVLAKVDGTTVTIDNFTTSELSGLVAMVASSNIDVSAAADLTGAVTTITGDATLALDAKTTDMNTSGDTSATSQFGGNYNFIFKQGGFDITSTTSVIAINKAGSNNSATMNAGLATYSETSDQHRLIVSKATGPSVSTSNLAFSTETGSAPYYETATHQLYIADVIGATTPDGLQFAFPTAWSDAYSTMHGIHFGGKKLTAAPSLSGKSFHLIGLQHYMENDFGTNAFFEAETYSGTIDFTSASAASYTLFSKRLQMQLNDTIAETLFGPDSLADLTYTVGSTGTLSVSSPTHGGVFLKGFISGTPDGNYVGGLIADGGIHAGHNGIVIIEAATTASNAILNGKYHLFSSCTDMSDPDATIGTYNADFGLETASGEMTFDSATGNATITNTSNKTVFNAGGMFGNMSLTPSPSSMTTAPFAYSVAPYGTLSFGTAMGAVSANGNMFAFTDYGTGYRCINIGLKQ